MDGGSHWWRPLAEEEGREVIKRFAPSFAGTSASVTRKEG
jgi:hypothetical protein